MLPTTATLILDLDVTDFHAEGSVDVRVAIRAVGPSAISAVGMVSNEAAEDMLEANGYHHSTGAVWRRA
jgi:hypothetical protein